jgi:CRP-like cAMP-binding protein
MDDSPPLREFLTSIPLFGGLDEATLGRIVGMLKEQRFGKGEVVCREGDSGSSIYIVRRGEVVVCRAGDTIPLLPLIRVGRGEDFGEMTLIDVQPRSATIIVEADAKLYSITNRDLYQLYREDMPGYVMVIQNLCRELSRRLRRADSKITDLADRADDDHTQLRPSKPGRTS